MKDLERELNIKSSEIEYWEERLAESENACEKYCIAVQEKYRLIREIALSKGEECVFPLKQKIILWDYGAPAPKAFVNHRKAFLFYRSTLEFCSDADIIVLSQNEDSEYFVLLSFVNVRFCSIGGPNEDSIINHELWNKGLEGLGGGIVKNSSKIAHQRSLENHLHESMEVFWNEVEHFIFCFKDQMFECLANDFTISVYQGTGKEVLTRVVI